MKQEELEQFEYVIARFETAWNRHDGRELATLFASDAEFISVSGLWWRGRDQIEAAHIQCHARAHRSSVLHIKITTARFVSAEAAIAVCEWDITGQRGTGDVVLPPRAGIMSVVFTQSAERWLIATLHNNHKAESSAYT